ncbi:hypothetical protein [Paenibacillus turpanensis]|uniref:hypothetical protein n=1 Tax=Paenibacillus turpanensis TaxID=2689078 RepID=UPI00140D329F|nr:hypothetical protein [Paenibacillus turpanensis]
MREYTLKREDLLNIYKKAIPFSIISAILPIVIFVVISSQINEAFISRILFVFILILILYRVIKETIKILNIRRDWISFKITVSNESITKTQVNIPDVEILKKDVVRIVKAAGGFTIQTVDPQKSLFVPNQLGEYEDFESHLSTITPIEVSPINSIQLPPEFSLKQHVKPGSIFKKLSTSILILLAIVMVPALLLLLAISILTN